MSFLYLAVTTSLLLCNMSFTAYFMFVYHWSIHTCVCCSVGTDRQTGIGYYNNPVCAIITLCLLSEEIIINPCVDQSCVCSIWGSLILVHALQCADYQPCPTNYTSYACFWNVKPLWNRLENYPGLSFVIQNSCTVASDEHFWGLERSQYGSGTYIRMHGWAN